MTKEESLYQVKLILDNLNDEDYEKIPDEIWDYIYENMEYNPNITVDEDKPLLEQDIDEKTYDFLEKLIYNIEHNPVQNKVDSKKEDLENYDKEELISLIKKYQTENSKISKIKDLINEYKENLSKNINEINNLKETNLKYHENIKKCPKIIRKIFFRDFEEKLLK
ncbi:MAG: hypothetical protein IKF38_00085 [Clostridia bacterium]|nr:hypothetical protein [Clostridia bacterium]